MDTTELVALAKPVVKLVWEQVIHPELLKLEAGITQADLEIVAAALDAAVDKIVEAELAKA